MLVDSPEDVRPDDHGGGGTGGVHTPSTRRAQVFDDSFGLQDLKTMVARWEQQEKGETTPTMEAVSSRGRRRSEKLEEIVSKLNLEFEAVTGKLTSSKDKNFIDNNIPATSGKFGRNKNSTTLTLDKDILTLENNVELLNHPNNSLPDRRKRSRESESPDGGGLCFRKRWRGPSLGN